ncbi:uncharacterized protein LOC111403684 [Olea europaea var. sylvestris]|uniref:uncharacterized protein LOC111403684 n=1 Tax=Olea europaea var. sylvestris TaxID=158386 RepID=UPI000C1D016F|nr:uncharacterized protein LOC111403684 [Olea europaea var. sylvestris]
MLDNPSMESAATAANIATVRRYAPPNQRNRSLGRRKSGGGMIYEPNCLSNNLVSILCYIGVPLLIAAPFYFERVHASDLERLERANSYSNDGEKNAIGTVRSIPMTDHGDAGGNNRTNGNPRFKSIPLHGCCNSEALQLLNDRWTAAMSAFNNLPEDSTDRPVFYSRKSASAWNQTVLPHLLMQQADGPSTGLQGDFLSELQQAMHNANTGLTA